MPAIYIAPLAAFLETHPERILGSLTIGLAREGFDSTPLTVASWQCEIRDLQKALATLSASIGPAGAWTVLLEYVLPIVGKRVDCVLLARDLVVVIEYKGGHSASAGAALRQAQQYALDLMDFHEASRGRVVIPFALGAFEANSPSVARPTPAGAALAPDELPAAVSAVYKSHAGILAPIDPATWNHSRYFPVPTIIDAATAVYANHGVKNLAFSRSGTENLDATEAAVAGAVRDAVNQGRKRLVVITGVPGAGKTLAGLNVVQVLQRDLDLEHEQASFLSGNGPLVKVLQEALKRNIGRDRRRAARSVHSRIRDMHRFVRDTYGDTRPPADRLIVFDEAQRAWTAAKNRKKFGRDVSEPEMVLEIMGRHQGWAVVVALVGGGQEIHSGEAGLAAWGDALARSRDWEVVTSPEALHGGPAVAGSRLFYGSPPDGISVAEDGRLHLAISRRSFETEVTASWVNAVLDGNQDQAASLALSGLPVCITRSLPAARRWLLEKTRGERRSGLIASSGALRLRAEGVEPPTFSYLSGIDYVRWFLEPAGDHRSSNQLEVALSEFEMQGLEIDFAGLLWGGDLVFEEGQPLTRALRGTRWVAVEGSGDPQASADDQHIRILNKYRVLLTRFRKAMVIFVPRGAADDRTREPLDLDSVFNYLVGCGVGPLPMEE